MGMSQPPGQLRQVGIPHTHGIPGVGYPPGFLVDEVPSLVGNVLVLKPDPLHLPLVVPGAPLHAGELLPHPVQPLPGARQVRQNGAFALAVHVKPGGRVIETQRLLRRHGGRLHPLGLIAKGGGAEILAAPALGNGHIPQLPAGKRPAVNRGRHQTQLRHLDSVAQKTHGRPGTVLAAVDGKGVPPGLLSLEPRVLKSPGIAKKIQKRLPQVLVDTAQRLTVHLPQKRSLPLVAGRGRDIVLVRGSVKLLHVLQHPVPEPAAAAERLFYQHGLFRGGMKAELDGGILLHSASLRPLNLR